MPLHSGLGRYTAGHLSMTPHSDSQPRSRREFLTAAALGAVGVGLAVASSNATAQGRPLHSPAPLTVPDAITGPGQLPTGVPSAITVYKDPNCGCCAEWVKHIKAAGFVATVRDTADMPTVKASMGVPSALESCHTARVGSYVIEGHVPADVIVKLLQTKPLALGLAVPGMPMGSPGMEGGKPDKYDIMLFDKTGKSRVFASR